jgi:hypothetical protein
MSQKKVLLSVKVKVVWSLLDEFNKFWEKEYSRHWKTHGAKHIGSYVFLVGGPINEIVRLFEFKDLSHWEKFSEWLYGEKFQENQKGRTIPPEDLLKYITSIEQELLVSVY